MCVRGAADECRANFNPALEEISANGKAQRRHEFDDLHTSSNSTAMENFWWAIGGHYNPQTAQLFYATQAWASTHAVGRVTCPITGHVANDGTNPHNTKTVHIRPGFFATSVRDPRTKGMQNLKESFGRAMRYLSETQYAARTRTV